MSTEHNHPPASPERLSLGELGVIGQMVSAIIEQHIAERALKSAPDTDVAASFQGFYSDRDASYMSADLARTLPSEVVNRVVEALGGSSRVPDRMLAATFLGVQQQGMVERVQNGQTLIGTNPDAEVSRWLALLDNEQDPEALENAWEELYFVSETDDEDSTRETPPTPDDFVQRLRQLRDLLIGR